MYAGEKWIADGRAFNIRKKPENFSGLMTHLDSLATSMFIDWAPAKSP